MKPLTVREWLEAERLSGLPHADFAADALTALDELDARVQMLDDLHDAFGYPDDMIVTARASVAFAESILVVLEDAGLVTADQNFTDVDLPSLLRMFLPT